MSGNLWLSGSFLLGSWHFISYPVLPYFSVQDIYIFNQCIQHFLMKKFPTHKKVKRILERTFLNLSSMFCPGEGQWSLAHCSPMGLQRVHHNLATEQQQHVLSLTFYYICFITLFSICPFIYQSYFLMQSKLQVYVVVSEYFSMHVISYNSI